MGACGARHHGGCDNGKPIGGKDGVTFKVGENRPAVALDEAKAMRGVASIDDVEDIELVIEWRRQQRRTKDIMNLYNDLSHSDRELMRQLMHEQHPWPLELARNLYVYPQWRVKIPDSLWPMRTLGAGRG